MPLGNYQMIKRMIIATGILAAMACSAHAEPKFFFRYGTGAVKTASATPEPETPEVPEVPETPETPEETPKIIVGEISATYMPGNLPVKIMLTNPNSAPAAVRVVIESYWGEGADRFRSSMQRQTCLLGPNQTGNCGWTLNDYGTSEVIVFVEDFTIFGSTNLVTIGVEKSIPFLVLDPEDGDIPPPLVVDEDPENPHVL